MTENNYQNLVYSIISLLKQEKDHEGTASVITPSELLDKIAALASDMTDIVDKIHGVAQ